MLGLVCNVLFEASILDLGFLQSLCLISLYASILRASAVSGLIGVSRMVTHLRDCIPLGERYFGLIERLSDLFGVVSVLGQGSIPSIGFPTPDIWSWKRKLGQFRH